MKKLPSEPTSRSRLWRRWLIVGMAVVALIAVTIPLVTFLAEDGKEAAGSAHFYQVDAKPELSSEGIKVALTEVYYTKDKHLALKMCLSNGLDVDQHMVSLEVKSLTNGNGELIATGYTDAIDESFVIPAMGYETFTLYISPEYVKIDDDSLETLTYEIEIKGEKLGTGDPSSSAVITTTEAGGDITQTTA